MKYILYLLFIPLFILSCNNENDKIAKESVRAYLKSHILEGVRYTDDGFGELYAVGTSDQTHEAFNTTVGIDSLDKWLEEIKPFTTFAGFGIVFTLSSGREAYDHILKSAMFCDSIIVKNKFTPNEYVISHKFTVHKKDKSKIEKEMTFRLDSTMSIKGVKEREN